MTEHNTTPAPGGHKAYRKKLHGAASREEILLSLNKGIYGFLKAAKFSYEQDSLDKMCRNTQKSLQIIQALKGHFATLEAGKNGAILQRYYDFIFKKIVLIQRSSDILSEFDHILSTLENFCRTLEQAASPRKSGQNFPTRANIVA